MKKGFSIRLFTGLIILLFASIVGSMQPVRAENETKELTSIAREQDLAVMFLFDKENVEITFISPSGDRVTKETEGVDFADGDLWATYRIHNAQLGTWSVEYDRGANEKIEYSIIKDDYGLWITSFEMTESDEEDAFAVKFQADCEDLNGYNFEIYAENTEDASESHKLDYGYAATGEEWNGIVRMTGVSSGKYVLKLEIYAEDGDVELFDNASTEEFSYRNPNEPAAIDNFKISVNQGLGICSLDWSEVAERSHAEYRLKAWQDGELIYENKYDSSVKKDDVFFTDGAKTLEISLSHKVNGIWSEPRKRTLDLEKESLTNVTKQGNG